MQSRITFDTQLKIALKPTVFSVFQSSFRNSADVPVNMNEISVGDENTLGTVIFYFNCLFEIFKLRDTFVSF